MEQMVENLANVLHCSPGLINIKATTTEKLGYIGRGEGVAAEAIVLVRKKEEK
jgi:2-C-methyl-D-erythritol 2,4-cyclodiphosphate synthase